LELLETGAAVAEATEC